MDLFIEKLVLKFGRNRSRNNEVMTILNIWWKKRRILLFAPWTPNFRIFWIIENGSCSSRWGKSNGVYPIEIGLDGSEHSLNGATEELAKFSSESGLKLNWEKTSSLFIGSQNSPDCSSNELLNKIKWVDEIKILRIYLLYAQRYQ